MTATKLDQATLDFLLENFHKSVPTGRWIEPYTIPPEWDDESGTLEAMEEIFAAKDHISHKKGFIHIDESLGLSEKALDIINRWNRLNLSIYYKAGTSGNFELTVAGVGNGGFRKDLFPHGGLLRGVTMLVVALRQCADFCETPDGEEIVSVVDPFTGGRLQFTGFNPSKGKITPIASQDHWEKPVDIYGHLAEVDLIRNSRFLAGKHSPEKDKTISNEAKGKKTPLRAVYSLLVDNKLLEKEKGPKGLRYHPSNPKLSFLPPGVTREWEEGFVYSETCKWAVDLANAEISRHMEEYASISCPSFEDAEEFLWSVIRLIKEGNYKFRPEAREDILTDFEKSLISPAVMAEKDILKKFWKEKQKGILQKSGLDPESLRNQILSCRVSSV